MAPPAAAVRAVLVVLLLGERFDAGASAGLVADELVLVLGGEMGVDEVERPRLLVRYDVAPGTLPAEAGGVARPYPPNTSPPSTSIFLTAASLNSLDPTPTWPCVAVTPGVTGALDPALLGDVEALFLAPAVVVLTLEVPVAVAVLAVD